MRRINEKRRALELLCRKVNPPHEPMVYRTLSPGEWVEGGIDLGDGNWKGAYLRGLNTHHLRLPRGAGAFGGATLDDAMLTKEIDPQILQNASLLNVAYSGGKAFDVNGALTNERVSFPLFPVSGEFGGVASLIQLDDGSLVAGTYDGYLIRIEPGTGRRQVVGKHMGAVLSVCGLEGDLLASGSDDRTVRIWDVNSGKELRTLQGHSSSVFNVCGLSGGLLASGSDDKTVRIWDVNSGMPVRIYWAFGDIHVSVHRKNGITVSTDKRGFDTQNVGGDVLPADKELYERISFAVRDKARENDPDAPLFYVPLYQYKPGKPGEQNAPWYWHDDSYRALTCRWPKDEEMRKRALRLYFGEDVG